MKFNKIVKNIIIISVLISSCYTKTKQPDYTFMKRIKQQAALDSSLKTRIELHPRKYFFGVKKNTESLTGSFYIKNVGTINFNAVSIRSNCDCIKTQYQTKTIKPNDSLKVHYTVNIKNQLGYISGSIVAIGNCQFGNQTHCFEGTIINK